MNNEILTIQEIQDAGFIHTPYVTFAYNKDTDAIYCGEDRVPCVALTYLLGEEKEWDIRLHDVDGVKKRAIEQMKKLGIKWVYSVYYGEIYIPKDQTNRDRYHHIFARATIKKTISNPVCTQSEIDSRVELLETEKNVLRCEIEKKEVEISRLKSQLEYLEDAVYLIRM